MHKPKQYWNVKTSSVNKNEVDVFIYGIIGSGWFGDESDTTAFDFVPEFKNLENKYDKINIRINSPGGSILDGLPVFNAIRQSKKDIHTYNDGIAYSMAAIILLAGKTVHSAKNALTLLHSPISWAGGNAKEFRSVADDLDKYSESLMQCVSEKTGLAIDQVKAKYFDYEDHLMTAQESLSDKLIDVIEDSEGKVPDNISNLTFRQVMDHYQKTSPNERDGFVSSLVHQLKSVFNISAKQTTNDIIMENIEKFQKVLNLEATATVEDVLNSINTLVSEKKTLEDKVSTLQSEKDASDQAKVKAESDLAEMTTKYDALKAEDAAKETAAKKDKDKIETNADTPVYGHDKVADEYLGK